jgi:AcrR family transcriptional regulator
MAGRPRTHSDDALLDATFRAVGAVGPAQLTLADVAREAGVAPATLVQRFGSKRELLVAAATRSAARAGTALPDGGDAPVDALVDGLVALTGLTRDPAAFANHLALLQLDLADPQLRALAVAHARGLRRAIRALLDAAVVAGEIEPCDTGALADAVHATFHGAQLDWAVDRRGTLARRVRRALDAVLRP